MKNILMSLYVTLLFSSITFAQSLMASATTTNISCNGDCDGSVSINASGGTSPYSYSKDNGLPQTSNTFNGLCPGSYYFKIEDSENNSYEFFLDILEPAPLNTTINISPSGNENSGVIEFIATGGTPQYEYTIDSVNFYSTNIFSDLVPGVYEVSVRDSGGCFITIPVEVYEENIDNTVDINEDRLVANLDADTYQWINSETQTVINGETNKILIPEQSGKYRVEMTTTISSNFLEKSSKSNQTISISSATYDFNKTLDITENPYKTIKLYPNPANDYLKLNSDEYEEYIIYSSLGKKIQSKKIKNQTISINNLSKGLYYIKFDNNATYRFIKN